jgi:hypothetical protein
MVFMVMEIALREERVKAGRDRGGSPFQSGTNSGIGAKE